MAKRARTIVKLGGSLLHSPAWPTRFTNWMRQQPVGDYYIVAGGGLLIDALRDLDDRHSLSQVEMHWRCIRTLDMTFEIVAEMLPEVDRIESVEQFLAATGKSIEGNPNRTYLVRVASYYNAEADAKATDETRLEYSWNTTSDSLALLLAYRIGAERCVLLKSCEVKHLKSLQQAVDEAVVDSECLRFQSMVQAIEFVRL